MNGLSMPGLRLPPSNTPPSVDTAPDVRGGLQPGASAVLGHLGTIRLLYDFITDFAANVKDENPKMARDTMYGVLMIV